MPRRRRSQLEDGWADRRGVWGLLACCDGVAVAEGACWTRGRRGEIGGNGRRSAQGRGPWSEEGCWIGVLEGCLVGDTDSWQTVRGL